jgi:transcriptional regulator with XRE-family HTH domain
MPDGIKDFLAERVKERRREAGISQETLADRSGLSLALISEIERKATNPKPYDFSQAGEGP